MDAEDRLYEYFAREIRSKRPLMEKAIEEITGWVGVEDIATICIETIVRNMGGGGGMPWRTRCACGNRPLDNEGDMSATDR